MDVSIIIVNYNTAELICNAVQSILEKTEGISYEIIVVDNNSADSIAEIMTDRFNDRVATISLPENLGFGRANNKGLERAHGRHILFLNPDTLLINNAITILCRYLDAHPQVGAVGGNLYDGHGRPTHSFSRQYPSAWQELNLLLLNLPRKLLYGRNAEFNHTDRPFPVAFITGAALMVRTEILSNNHGFDPDFFMYYEDAELCFRINQANYDLINVPNARIIHLEGKSFADSAVRRFERLIAGRKTYYAKTHSRMNKKLADTLFLLYLYIKKAVFVFHPERRKHYGKIIKSFTANR